MLSAVACACVVRGAWSTKLARGAEEQALAYRDPRPTAGAGGTEASDGQRVESTPGRGRMDYDLRSPSRPLTGPVYFA
jgi:hypothetical protein